MPPVDDLDRVDLMDPAVQEDWYPAYRTLRERAPVWRMPTGEYLVTRYADVHHVLRHPDLFPNARPGENQLLRSRDANARYKSDGWPRRLPLSTNPPEHRRYRALVDGWFDADGAARARPLIVEMANRLIDGWIGEGEGKREIEFVTAYALPLPVMVITALIGFPLEDIPQLKVWSEAWVMPFARGLTEEQELYVAEKGVEFQRYIHEQIQRKRRAPGDDVLTALAHARFPDEHGERPLTDGEIINIVDHLYIGGNETTTFALTSGLWLLLERPDVHRRLLEDPTLIPRFVDESLRLESPTQGLYRMVAEDTEIGGTFVPKGSVLHVRYGAANRDDRMFADPDVLDLGRANAGRHVAFAAGEHRCPGEELSKMEQRISFELLLDRLADLRLTPGRNDFTHRPGFVLRALKELHISFGRRG